MRAVRIHGKEDLRVEEVATPVPGPGEVLLRMAYAGICGSDLHYYYEGANGAFVVREPLIPGHEVCGVVEEDPSGQFAPGVKVTVHPARFGTPSDKYGRHLWPGGSYLGSASTWPHTQGGMSEFLLVDASMIIAVPEQMALRTAALAEPLAVVLHGINIAGGVKDKRVLVSGCGPIGLLAAAAARAQGAAEVWCVDVLDAPLARARQLGVDRALRSDLTALPETYFDVVLECTGVPAAINTALAAVERAGIVAQIGMMPAGPQPLELATAIAKEVQIRPSFRFDDELGCALELLDAQPHIADVVVSHCIPFERAGEAFAVARDASASGKVLVELNSSAN